jgi:acetyl esterase/lipase
MIKAAKTDPYMEMETDPMPTLSQVRRYGVLRQFCAGAAILVIAGMAAACQPVAPAATPEPQAAAVEQVAEPTAAPQPEAATAEPAAAAPGDLPPLPEGGAGGPLPEGMTQVKATPVAADVAYASASETQKLDLYVPEGDGPFPVIINLHPGGFMVGDKSNPAATDELLAAGYAVASPNYRLSGEAIFPAPIQDAKAAVRWLRAHATEYNLDPERFGAFGQSAGGNLAALLGTSCGAAELEGADLGNADQSSCVQAVVDWFGPIDFLTMDEQFTGTSCPATHNAADSPESKLLGGPVQSTPDAAKAANPITYISPETPPFFIQHGTADCNVPPQQAQQLYDALVPAIGADRATLTYLEGAGHGGPQFTETANIQAMVAFLDKYLKD